MSMKFTLLTAAAVLAAFAAAGIRSFEAVPLESVSETTANVSIGDLNGDGILDIVLAKGRHWPLKDLAAADLNGDGLPDIVAARSDAPSLLLFNRSAK
jgi:FG-GAP repeat